MSEWRDFCEGLDDSDRLLAEIYQWLETTHFETPEVINRAGELHARIAEHLGIK